MRLISIKRITTLLLCLFPLNNTFAQTAPVYITGTAVDCPDDHVGIFEGFSKMLADVKSFNAQPTRVYYIGNIEKNYEITLMYYNYANKENNPEILDMPITALAELDKVISVEELMNFKDADTAYNWMLDTLENKVKIYIIDSNEYYKSDTSLAKPDRMKVVEVKISYHCIPEHILNSVPFE